MSARCGIIRLHRLHPSFRMFFRPFSEDETFPVCLTAAPIFTNEATSARHIIHVTPIRAWA
jgi:hypothetical protein